MSEAMDESLVRVALTGADRTHVNTLRIPPGRLVLITDIPVMELNSTERREGRRDRFTLTSTDGSYTQTGDIMESDTDDRWVNVIFEGLPTQARYTLKASLHGEAEVIVFENVPYSELAQASRELSRNLRGPNDRRHTDAEEISDEQREP